MATTTATPPLVRARTRPRRRLPWGRVLLHSTLVGLSLLFVAPFFWMLATALKPPSEVFSYPPTLLPSELRWEVFGQAWRAAPFDRFLINSLLVTGISILAQVASSALVADGFARFRFAGRDALFAVVLAAMLIPWDVTMIPQYMLFKELGWINTLKPLIVPNFFGAPFFIFLLRQFFLTVPVELEEAARLDGANALQIFLLVVLPLAAPVLIVVGIYQLLNAWNDYLGPLIFLNSQNNYTLTLGIAQFKSAFSGQTQIRPLLAITLLACIPPIVAFFLAQRHFMAGVSRTGIK
jgi:multiple sugar transport system permease protein